MLARSRIILLTITVKMVYNFNNYLAFGKKVRMPILIRFGRSQHDASQRLQSGIGTAFF